ncbi:MAG: M56 family metallopeptidase [Prevotella sp.]|nr:M56 family metallopeptidase [Prevotella sp.]
MIYIIKIALTLALLYCSFFIFLSRETFHRFNRCMLVGIMVTSLIVPAIHLQTKSQTMLNDGMCAMQQYMENDPMLVVVMTEQASGVSWLQVIMWIYLLGVALMLCTTVAQAIALIRFMQRGIHHSDSKGNTVILHNSDTAPFSIFHYIVMSVSDYESHRQYILLHEQEHIRLGHTFDLLLLQFMKTVQWFNPFIWLLGRDLKIIHEYEADQAVINQGIDAKIYQQLLVIKVVGNRLQPFTNNLNHGSLKKRITMMYQKPSNRWLMLKALYAIPVVALTINAFATPNMSDSVNDMVNTLENSNVLLAYTEVKQVKLDPMLAEMKREAKDATIETESEAQATKDNETTQPEQNDYASTDEVFMVAEQNAAFTGGNAAMTQYLTNNLKYPKVAFANNVCGKVVISFIIEKDGSCSNFEVKKSSFSVETSDKATSDNASEAQAADTKASEEALTAEALRVCEGMPKWQPAKQKGQVVRQQITLPITFRLH